MHMLRVRVAMALISGVLWAVSPSAAMSPNTDLIGFVPDVGQAKDVVVDSTSGLAYVASIQFGLAVVDISNPVAPVVIGAANPPFYAEHVAVSGAVATLISGQFGMQVVDL